MIEVNLMPRKPGRSPGAARPPADGSPSRAVSPWRVAACVPGLAGLLVLAWLHPGVRDQRRATETRLAQALDDSAGFAGAVSVSERLRAGRDSIAARTRIIRELDQGRYAWPRILDEVAVALPDYAWLTRIAQRGAAGELQVEIEGRAGDTFALTRFMSRLEASPFLTAASLVSTEQIVERVPGRGEWILNSFVLQVGYQPPPAPPGGEPLPDDAGGSPGAAGTTP